jgi:hypothetical protein
MCIKEAIHPELIGKKRAVLLCDLGKLYNFAPLLTPDKRINHNCK